MTLVEIMQPFVIVIDWLRTYQLHLGEFTLTFMDLFVWSIMASIVIGFIVSIRD